ncbi:MAG: SDR family oxidoreductase, partial [Candidatus Krumholzibacteria bacterium]|nr:SDR family oxidoreductase [Candidatus Krumholzibacteria bacterium]
MSDRLCLVTGASSGIGFETARGLAREGERVLILGRDEERTAQAATKIYEESRAEVIPLVADLSSQKEISSLAAQLRLKYSKLDLLVNNAGAVFPQRRLSGDGIEMTFALNHLSYFLLTRELEGLLRAAAPSRIVNVASAMHARARFDIEDLQCEKLYRPWDAYARSKYANLLYNFELSRRLEGSGVSTNAAHPGLVNSRIAVSGELGFWGRLFFRLFGKSEQNGARCSLYLSSSSEVEGKSGGYYSDCQETESHPGTRNPETALRL